MADADHHSETLMKSLASNLVQAFDECPSVAHLDCHPLPNRDFPPAPEALDLAHATIGSLAELRPGLIEAVAGR